MPFYNRRFGYAYDSTTELTVYGLIFAIAIVSFFANGFVFYLISRMKFRWSSFSHQLIGAITLTDMLSTFGVFLAHIARFVMGFPQIFESTWYCRFFSTYLVMCTCYSGVLVAMLSFERYFLICLHRSIYPSLGWTFLIGLWLTLFVPAIGNAIEDGFSPDPTFSFCWPNGNSWAVFENNVITYMFMAPLFILTFCYISIFVTCYRWKEEPLTKNRLNIERKVEAARMSRKVAYRALFFILFYFLCFGPKITTILWFDLGNPKTHPFFLYTIDPVAIQLVMAVNPVLVIFLHRQFKREAQAFFRKEKGDVDSEFKVLS